jgi:hypothetical protein
VLPTVDKRDQDRVLPLLRIVRRQCVEPLGDAVHLTPVVAAPLIVKLDDGEFVGGPGHEAMEGLMLLVRDDPGLVSRHDRRKALKAVVRLRRVHWILQSQFDTGNRLDAMGSVALRTMSKSQFRTTSAASLQRRWLGRDREKPVDHCVDLIGDFKLAEMA